MKRLLLAAFGMLALLSSVARADYVIKDGAGVTQTVKSGSVGGSILPYSVLVDNAGAVIFGFAGVPSSSVVSVQGVVSGTAIPISGTVAISGTVTVSGTVAATQSGTWTIQTASQAPVAPATATATKADLTACQATSAGINPTTGQQAAIDCDLNNNVLVSAGGAPNLTAAARVSVTSSNTSVASARALRRAITITNITGSAAIDCSGGATATTTTGQYIPGVVGASFTANTTAQVSCISEGTTQTVSVAETF